MGTVVSAAPEDYSWMDSTNRVTLSLRFGLNIKANIKGIGSDFAPGALPGIYEDGYVMTDSTGNALGYTSYWGYDNASQNDEAGSPNNSITFHEPTITGVPPEITGQGDDRPDLGAELTYDRQLWVKDDWHHMRFGVEGAVNYMRISFNQDSSFNAQVAETPIAYSYQSGDTPPPLPPSGGFQGTYAGSGYMQLQVPQSYTGLPVPEGAEPFTSQDQFNADIWGGRLGPYMEIPLTKKLDLRFSVGLAAALIDAQESWSENLQLGGGSSITTSGSGDDWNFLWGGYAALDATWQLSNHWGLAGGAQFEDLGKFGHTYSGNEVEVVDKPNGVVNSFSGRFPGHEIELNMTRSIFFELGISYSFK